MSSQLASFNSSKGKADYVSAYDAVLKLWPVPFKEIDITTRFGTTPVIASGSKELPSLLLLHATGANSTIWFPNIGTLLGSGTGNVVDSA